MGRQAFGLPPVALDVERARDPVRCRDKPIGFEMNFCNCFGSLFAIGLVTAGLVTAGLVTAFAAPAHAQTRVGEAAVVKNEVLRVAGPSTAQINVGDGLLRDETVRTGIDSATRLVMADSTNLSLGPNATLKLDRPVFDDGRMSVTSTFACAGTSRLECGGRALGRSLSPYCLLRRRRTVGGTAAPGGRARLRGKRRF